MGFSILALRGPYGWKSLNLLAYHTHLIRKPTDCGFTHIVKVVPHKVKVGTPYNESRSFIMVYDQVGRVEI
jgi:hypothetical protein